MHVSVLPDLRKTDFGIDGGMTMTAKIPPGTVALMVPAPGYAQRIHEVDNHAYEERCCDPIKCIHVGFRVLDPENFKY